MNKETIKKASYILKKMEELNEVLDSIRSGANMRVEIDERYYIENEKIRSAVANIIQADISCLDKELRALSETCWKTTKNDISKTT